MSVNINRGGRPRVANKCDNCVKVRFDDLEFDRLMRMMEKAGETVRATFIKNVLFGKTFKVQVIDKTGEEYLAKLSGLFTSYRSLGVNYNIAVRELRNGFSEKKAMTLLYRLEKQTKELAEITGRVLALSEELHRIWLQKSR